MKLRWILWVLMLANITATCASGRHRSVALEDSPFELSDNLFDNSESIDLTRTPTDDLRFLIGTLHLNKIIAHDLYIQTAPLNDRDILTFASMLDWTKHVNSHQVSVFFNACPNMFCSCQDILSYLALDDPELIHELNLEIIQLEGIDPARMLALFKNARVEQRRVGIMFEFQRRLWQLNIGLQFPFYYVERNYNLPEQDAQAIKSADFTQHSDTTHTNEQAYHKIVLDDRIGVGNTRLSCGWHALESDIFSCVLGAKATLPTAFALKSGIIGSNFAKKAQPGVINLETVTAQAQGNNKAAAATTLAEYGTSAINWMGQALLATDLGEEKRFKLGVFFEPTVYAHDRLWFQASARFDWLTPRRVNRMVKEYIDYASLQTEAFEPFDVDTSKKFLVLQDRLNQMVFPPRYTARDHWQFEGQLTVQGTFVVNDNWACVVGYDYWHRAADKLRCFKFCKGYESTHPMHFELAPRSSCSMQMLMAELQYSQIRHHSDFLCKIGADLPIESQDIGMYFTGFVRCEWNF